MTVFRLIRQRRFAFDVRARLFVFRGIFALERVTTFALVRFVVGGMVCWSPARVSADNNTLEPNAFAGETNPLALTIPARSWRTPSAINTPVCSYGAEP